jgi:hypothetical protein
MGVPLPAGVVEGVTAADAPGVSALPSGPTLFFFFFFRGIKAGFADRLFGIRNTD